MARTSRSTRSQVQSSASPGQGLLQFFLVCDGAFDDVLEQRPVGVTAHAALTLLTDPYLQELVDDLARGVLTLLPLKDRLHRRHPRSLATIGAEARCRLGAHAFRQRR